LEETLLKVGEQDVRRNRENKSFELQVQRFHESLGDGFRDIFLDGLAPLAQVTLDVLPKGHRMLPYFGQTTLPLP
jgi:hypothetical protein